MMHRFPTASLLVLLAGICTAASAAGKDPFRFPAQKHGRGELKYINGVPVLVVEGTPQQIHEAEALLEQARRTMYQILADDENGEE